MQLARQRGPQREAEVCAAGVFGGRHHQGAEQEPAHHAPTPADNPYKLREDRNTITLLFEKPLDENTTYSFNFRDAVVDITEGLPAKNAYLNFSTGPVLDSGKVSGTVTDVLTARPVAEASVGLYREADTAGVRRGRPYYSVLTDKEGKFSSDFSNPGRTKSTPWLTKTTTAATTKARKLPTCPSPSPLRAAPPAHPWRCCSPSPTGARPWLTSRQASPTQLRLSFNEGLRDASWPPLGSTAAATAVAEALQVTDRGRTVVLFKTPEVGDGRYLLTATDSTGNVGRDTLQVKFAAPPAAAKKRPRRRCTRLRAGRARCFPRARWCFSLRCRCDWPRASRLARLWKTPLEAAPPAPARRWHPQPRPHAAYRSLQCPGQKPAGCGARQHGNHGHDGPAPAPAAPAPGH